MATVLTGVDGEGAVGGELALFAGALVLSDLRVRKVAVHLLGGGLDAQLAKAAGGSDSGGKTPTKHKKIRHANNARRSANPQTQRRRSRQGHKCSHNGVIRTSRRGGGARKGWVGQGAAGGKLVARTRVGEKLPSFWARWRRNGETAGGEARQRPSEDALGMQQKQARTWRHRWWWTSGGSMPGHLAQSVEETS